MDFNELRKLPTDELADELHQLALGPLNELVDEEPLCNLTADTNAYMWGVDTLEIDQASIKVGEKEITCLADVQYYGEQDEDRGACGNKLNGKVLIQVSRDKVKVSVQDKFKLNY